tara:strand:+ start:245 stop:352 length:108 start_codon:yes stop_codon:yes gene_type:complete
MLILVNIELIFIRILSIINPNLDAGSDEDQRKLEA